MVEIRWGATRNVGGRTTRCRTRDSKGDRYNGERRYK